MPAENITVTAQWEYAETLTIRVNGNENETFFFKVKGTTENVNFTVSVSGGDSVTIGGLYHDIYTVTELSDWSWTRNAVAAQSVIMRTNDDVANYEAAFTMPDSNACWLHNEHHN